ncbi:MAG: Uma2 family endonuclease [bacterium]|nr:Uma2 family endonuclease [bacterium]
MITDNSQTDIQQGMLLEDYLREANEKPFEIINGERVYQMPNWMLHSEILQRVFFLFYFYVSEHNWGRVYQETTYITPDRNDANWVRGSRIPDIMLFEGTRVAEYFQNTPDWIKRPMPIVPDMVIEVISHTDMFSKVNEKAYLDLANGVKVVWLIDPLLRKAWVYTPDGDSPVVFGAEGILTEETLLPNFKLELTKIWM